MIKNNLISKNNLIFLFINSNKTSKKYSIIKLYSKNNNNLNLYYYFYNFLIKKFLFLNFFKSKRYEKTAKIFFLKKNKLFLLKYPICTHSDLNLFYKKFIFYKINLNPKNYLSNNIRILKNIKFFFIHPNFCKNYFFKLSVKSQFILKFFNKFKIIALKKTGKNLLYQSKPFFNPINKKNLFYKFYSINLYFYSFFIKKISYNTSMYYSSFYSKFNNNIFIKYLISLKDFFYYNFKNKFILNFNSNNYLNNFYNFSDSQLNIFLNNKAVFNNYYPIFFLNKKNLNNSFFYLFKKNGNNNYLYLTNKVFINFFEKFIKKNIYIRIINNFFYDIKEKNFTKLLNEYKNYQPLYFKNFIFSDFLKIIWYSFKLKDLNLLSQWITKFMETLNFKNHKKFVMFFQNFIYKNSGLFINDLKIKGFFFDIRGKVGVTGSSKKRHISFKFGSLGKSTKKFKINFNQNLVRTYSGVLGLTYIICY